MRIRELGIRMTLAGCLAMLCASLAVAQINTVQLSGTVLDPQGASVAGAQITATSLATGAATSVTSDANGHFVVVGLPPGHYSLSVEARGFAKLVNPDVTLTLGNSAVINPQLTVAGGQQSVTVTGEPVLVQTERSDAPQRVTQEQIENLPIDGRDYNKLTLLHSQAERDSPPSRAGATTSGVNFGCQGAQSCGVADDRAEATANSANVARETVP